MNVSVVIANDFTGDGCPDLFVGGRSYPEFIGSSPRSFLLVNDRQGRFTDQTTSLLPEIGVHRHGLQCQMGETPDR